MDPVNMGMGIRWTSIIGMCSFRETKSFYSSNNIVASYYVRMLIQNGVSGFKLCITNILQFNYASSTLLLWHIIYTRKMVDGPAELGHCVVSIWIWPVTRQSH
jgi:hypothetical protein